jgi:hypothetical protein
MTMFPPLDEYLEELRLSIKGEARKVGIEEPVITDEHILHVMITTLNFYMENFGWDQETEDLAVEASRRLPYPAPIRVADLEKELLVYVTISDDGTRHPTTEAEMLEFLIRSPQTLLERRVNGRID